MLSNELQVTVRVSAWRYRIAFIVTLIAVWWIAIAMKFAASGVRVPSTRRRVSLAEAFDRLVEWEYETSMRDRS